MAINHGVLSEKGNGKDRAKSIPKLIRDLLMEVVPLFFKKILLDYL